MEYNYMMLDEYQRDLESMFWLDCDGQDIKDNKDVRVAYKHIKRHAKMVKRYKKFINHHDYHTTFCWW